MQFHYIEKYFAIVWHRRVDWPLCTLMLTLLSLMQTGRQKNNIECLKVLYLCFFFFFWRVIHFHQWWKTFNQPVKVPRNKHCSVLASDTNDGILCFVRNSVYVYVHAFIGRFDLHFQVLFLQLWLTTFQMLIILNGGLVRLLLCHWALKVKLIISCDI